LPPQDLEPVGKRSSEPGIDPSILGSTAWKSKTILFDAVGHQHLYVAVKGCKKLGFPLVHGVAGVDPL